MQFAEHEILAYYPLVVSIAKKIISKVPWWVELDDIISAGVIGLLDAYSKFDKTRGNQFNTYAYTRIWGSIMDELRTQDLVSRTVRKKEKNGASISSVIDEPKESECLIAMIHEKRVRKIVNTLPENELMVMNLYYFQEMDMTEIGEVMGLSVSRICQIHGIAINRLRKKLGKC